MDAEENSADCETVVDAEEKSALRLLWMQRRTVLTVRLLVDSEENSADCETVVDAEENSSDCETVVDAEENSAALRLLWMQRRTVLL